MCVVFSLSDFGGFTGPNGAVTVNVTTADGDDEVALECPVAESNPPPEIIWLRNGNPLTPITLIKNKGANVTTSTSNVRQLHSGSSQYGPINKSLVNPELIVTNVVGQSVHSGTGFCSMKTSVDHLTLVVNTKICKCQQSNQKVTTII